MNFTGTFLGNVLGCSYFILFQCLGIACFMKLIGKKEGSKISLLLGSVAGSFLMQWLPLIFSIFTGFTILGHVFALGTMLLITLFIFYISKKNGTNSAVTLENQFQKKTFSQRLLYFIKEDKVVWIIAVTFLFFVCLLYTHTIPLKDGKITTGQATYGDMWMHLGFITSIATQGKFPPEYSILPGTKLSYPFLCDSISSSIYLFGASLKIAYILPMLAAVLQVMFGFYFFVKTWLKSAWKGFVAWILFFWNGGFGFLYFLNADKFQRIFTDFYFTPTNLIDKNVRWVQIIVDMLLPQRATLFGWAVLFPLLLLFYKAVKEKNKKYFIISAVFAGGLPLIHTHSFMAFGLVCVMWLLYTIKDNKKTSSQKPDHNQCYILRYAVLAGLLVFPVYQFLIQKNESYDIYNLLVMAAGIFILIIYMFYMTTNLNKDTIINLFQTWGIFLAIILVLAVPQLLYWTFQQTNNESFVRGHFNWSNESDQYTWFYIKNIGITALFFLPAYLLADKKELKVASPMLLIWFIAELAVFQPNVYDNNKLLFVGYLFMCSITAGFMVDRFQKIKANVAKALIGTAVFLLCTISAFLTMGREYVSKYDVFYEDQIALVRYIEQNLPKDAVVLTNDRHVNEVASLTGRNIVCGAGTYLYFHGLDYGQQQADLKLMYEDPVGYQYLYDKYNVSYIMIGPYENANYQINTQVFETAFTKIFSQGEVALYQRE